VVWPSLLKLGGLGTFIGLILGSGLAILLEKNADTFRDPSEVSNHLGTAVLTHVPFFRGKRRKLKKGEVDPYKTLSTDLAVVHQPASVTAEAIRSLRTAIFFDANNSEGGRVIQITSPLPGDGKSTIACNLASSIAQSGKRVLAIDCDLRRPQLTDNFDCVDRLGLTNVLNGECDPLEAAHPTPLQKLSVMPCGPIPSNPAEALSLPVMNELLDVLREHYDYIILDTPPLLVVTDPSVTASMADGVVLTLRIRRKSKPNAREALNILHGVNANVLGVVVNNSDEGSSADGYSGYGYYRYGRYGGKYHRRNGQASGTSVAVTTNGSLRRTASSGQGARASSKISIATQPQNVSSQSDSQLAASHTANGATGTTLVSPGQSANSRQRAKPGQRRDDDSDH
jgi:capsular exopolysaccharide synthesis family protein